ncbi:MAG: hypothetical protein WCG08_08590 [Paludibacter sp.]|jgi:hypothetical protein
MLVNLFVAYIQHATCQMIPSYLRQILFLLLILSSSEQAVSQEWNYARINVMYGSSIPFNFSTMDKIKKGVEINPGTRFGISLADSAKVGHILQGFVLNFRTFNNQNVIKGDSYSIPLNRIRVKAENATGLESGTSYGYLDLSSNWMPLFSFTNLTWHDLTWTNAQLNISFECGKPTISGGNGNLLGEEPDYYNVEIEFELVPTGLGF